MFSELMMPTYEYIAPAAIAYKALDPATFTITPQVLQQFAHHINEFNETFKTLHFHLNYLGSLVVNETNVIYTERHPDL